MEFLKEDVYVDYNPRMYDVLRRNCNHFSNELAQFLLHGKQLLPGCRPWRQKELGCWGCHEVMYLGLLPHIVPLQETLHSKARRGLDAARMVEGRLCHYTESRYCD